MNTKTIEDLNILWIIIIVLLNMSNTRLSQSTNSNDIEINVETKLIRQTVIRLKNDGCNDIIDSSLVNKKQCFENLSNKQKVEYVSDPTPNGFPTGIINGFLYTVAKSCNDGIPLIITPDVIMFVISSGFMHNMELNFMKQTDKKNLKIANFCVKATDDGEASQLDWQPILEKIPIQVGEYLSGLTIGNYIQEKYSTSTTESFIGRNILMNHYVEPTNDLQIKNPKGIPEIILRGDPEEWENICRFVDKISEKYDLVWWKDELNPILQYFVTATKSNKLDLNFWSNIISFVTYKSCVFCGWITKLFPFLVDGKEYYRNKFQSEPLYFCSVPLGITSTDLVLISPDQKEDQFHVLAGIVNCVVENSAICPQISICVKENKPTVIYGSKITDTKVDGFYVTGEALETVNGKILCYPTCARQQCNILDFRQNLLKYDNLIDYKQWTKFTNKAICDLCKEKNIGACVTNNKNYDLCLKCVDRVANFVYVKRGLATNSETIPQNLESILDVIKNQISDVLSYNKLFFPAFTRCIYWTGENRPLQVNCTVCNKQNIAICCSSEGFDVCMTCAHLVASSLQSNNSDDCDKEFDEIIGRSTNTDDNCRNQ